MRPLLFAGATVALVWVALEIAAMGLHVFANGHPFPKSALKREMKAAARGPIVEEPVVVEGGGARYVHVLQPNQYVAGSKPMSAAEEAIAIGKGHYGEAVRLGYPMLLERVAGLREGGVELVDLTRVFAEHEEALYVDDCCHVGPRGYELVAEAICGAL